MNEFREYKETIDTLRQQFDAGEARARECAPMERGESLEGKNSETEMAEKGEGRMSSDDQNETKIVFPSVSAQKQIAELKDLLALQKEHLDAVTTPENQNPNCQNELVARQLQQAHKTVEALKQIGATHVRIKNCLTHDLPERPIEAICLDYWKRSNQIDYEIGKIDDKIASISQLIVTLQSVFPNAKPSLEVGQNENELSGDGEQKRALSPLPH